MALPTRQTPRRALVSSAFKLGDPKATSYSKRLTLPWQQRALAYYDRIGEFRQASLFYARMMGKVEFYAGRQTASGSVERIDSGPPFEILDRIQDPGGGRTRVQYDYGRLMWVTGEGVLFAIEEGSNKGTWRFLWKDELRETRDGRMVRLGIDRQPTEDVGTGYRLWTPHPRHSDEADAPMRAIQDIAEEFLILSAAVRATAVSRITEGILVMPLEGIPSPVDATGDEDPNTNPFLQDYIEHISNAIENPGTAEARAPYLYTPPFDYADDTHLRWMQTHDPETDYMEQKLRDELLGRAAIAFDMPPEAFKGMADANHWTAKQVMHDMWISHGVPVAQRFADDVADAYLRPALREQNYPDVDHIVVHYDDSQVVISPDRSQQALEALQWGVIDYPSTRQALGYTEDAAPSDEDLAKIIALRSRDPLASAQELGLPGQRGPLPAPTSQANPSDGPPAPTNGRTGSRQEALRATLEAGAAIMAIRRCREIAGARIRSEAQHGCPDCVAETKYMAAAIVASALGTARVSGLGLTDPLKLVDGGEAGFREQLLEWGYGAEEAGAIARAIKVYAAKTLFEDKPDLPAGLLAQIERAREVSLALPAA